MSRRTNGRFLRIRKLSYYSNVEPEYFDYVISWYNKKYHCDVIKMMADDVAA